MNDPVRWGIIGPGRIASAVISDFAFVDGAEVVAVASRSVERAARFAGDHHIPASYGSYVELLDDADVDVVYIATPHPHHLPAGLAALRAGKAILVEKAFTATAVGATTLVAEGRRLALFTMEAMWTRFQPAVVRARELALDGVIGDIRSVQVDLGIVRAPDPTGGAAAHQLGQGALLDLGPYVASIAQLFLGQPESVTARGEVDPFGVDVEASVLVGFTGGTTATLMCSLRSRTPTHARIFGTTGWIDVLAEFHHPHAIVVHRQGWEPHLITLDPTGHGYTHELVEVTTCLRAQQKESTVMPLADTLAVQHILDEALHQMGVHYDDADLL